MNGFLLDTNTVSELVSVKPNQRVLDWMDAAHENRLFLSAITLGEIRRGVAALPQSRKRTRLGDLAGGRFANALRRSHLGG